MTTHTHAAGDFCWMSLSTPDAEAAGQFYGDLFGWETRPWPTGDDGGQAQAGEYRQITYRGAPIGALTDLRGEMPAWSLFFAVEDADAAADRVATAGGELLVDPFTAPGGSRVAFFRDPAGAFCGIQSTAPGQGIQSAMEPNTVCWVEVGSRDTDLTSRFYADLFGWRFETLPPGAGAPGYALIHNRDRNLGGMLEIDGNFPDGVGSYWMVYIGVEDLRSTLSELERLGGRLGFGPTEIPDGTFAVVSDPQGAHFAVIQPSPEAMARAAGQAG